MKSFKKLVSEVAQPKAEDEINFKAKHEIEKIPHPHADDATFKGKTGKFKSRRADYKKGEDEDVYEAKLDPVGKADADIDNDGDVDSSDKYLHARRKAISKAMKKESMNLDESIDQIKKHHVSDIAHFDSHPNGDAALNSHHQRMARLHNNAASKAKQSGNKRMADLHSSAANSHSSANGTVSAFKRAAEKTKQTFNEEAEQLDEIGDTPAGKKKLKNLIVNRTQKVADAGASMERRPEKGFEYDRAQKRHMKTIGRAATRLAKEANMAEDAWEEIPMMKRQLHFIAYAAEEIMEYLGDCEVNCVDPEEWFQNKLAHLHGQMRILHAYMEGEEHMMSMGMYGEEVKLDELSKKTLGSYYKAANKDLQKRGSSLRKTDDSTNKFRSRLKYATKAKYKSDRMSEEVKLDEAAKHYIIGSSGQNLTGHTSQPHFNSSEDAKAYQKKFKHVPHIKKAKIVKGTSDEHGFITTAKEEVDLDEVTRSAVKRPIKYTDSRGVTRTRLTTTRAVNRDEHGQEKIKESLQEAVKSGRMKLDDGSNVTVSKKDADLLNQMFNDLNTKNRKMMQDTMMTDKAGFEEIVGFAREAL